MRRLGLILKVVVFVLVGSFLHYLLPQHDIARVTGTEVIRMDFSAANRIFFAQADSGNVEGTTRDIRLINTVRQRTYLLGLIRGSEQVMVYRNEDTGWIWPPYFKFDSSDLQAEAQRYISTEANPQWVIIRHYGWRNRFFTIYPNATVLWPVDGPDQRIIPWFNIGFFAVLLLGLGFFRTVWRQFRRRTVDPAAERIGERWDGIEAGVTTQRGRIRRWLDTWKPKKR